MAEVKTKTGGTVAVEVGLVTKLSEITGLMAHVKKEGYNKTQNYRFVRETDVAERASTLLAERHIWIHQTVVSSKMTPLYITQSGMQMWLSEVNMEFRFIDGDTGETTDPQQFNGAGADTGDKGIYKAMTGAEKYFLMKTFLVSTGDDPEADEKVDKAAAASGARTGARVVRGNQAGVQRGGKSDHATTAQVVEIARLAKELGLDAEGVVPVIKRVIGSEPEEGQAMREWLGGLTSDQASSVILAMATMTESVEGTVEAVVHTPSTDVDEDDEQEELLVS